MDTKEEVKASERDPFGKPPEKEKLTAHVHFVETPGTVQAFKAEAERLGVDVSVIYRWALREYAEKIKAAQTTA